MGGLVVLGGDNVSPLVEIGLTDLPKSGGAAAPPALPLAASLHIINCSKKRTKLTILSIFFTQDSEIRSYFGRSFNTTNCF